METSQEQFTEMLSMCSNKRSEDILLSALFPMHFSPSLIFFL